MRKDDIIVAGAYLGELSFENVSSAKESSSKDSEAECVSSTSDAEVSPTNSMFPSTCQSPGTDPSSSYKPLKPIAMGYSTAAGWSESKGFAPKDAKKHIEFHPLATFPRGALSKRRTNANAGVKPSCPIPVEGKTS